MKAITILLGIYILGFAQTVYEVEPVVVTATRYPQNIMDITRTVTIVDSSEISKYSSLPEILKSIAGIDIKIRGDGIQADPGIRGSTFEQVLIMIDGIRVNDPQTGHHNLNIPIPLTEIERIEILHGSASSLYGSDACAGVINIITKKTDGITGSIGLGSFGYKNGAARFATGKVSANLEIKFSDGHEPGYEYSVYNIATKLNTNLTKSFNTKFLIGYLNKSFGAKNFYAPYPSWEKNQAFFINLNNQWYISPYFMLNPSILFRTHIDTFVLNRDDPDFYANRHQSYSYGAQLISNFALGKFGYFIAGGEIFRDSLNSTGLGQRQVQRTAFFVQGEKKFLNNNFVLVTGIRDDIYSNFGSSINPHFSLAYHPLPHLKFRGSTGSSFRAPSFTELYYQDPANSGDSLLLPERAHEYELGTDYYTESLIGKISLFLRRTEKDIDWVKKPEATVWRVRNIGHTQFYGAEASINLFPSPWFDFKTELAYIYIIEELPADYVSKYVLQTPHTALSCRLALFSLFDVSGRWLLFEEKNSRVFLNFLLKKEMRLLQKIELITSFAMDNILDKRYEDYQDVPLPGRSFSIKIVLSKIE